MNFVNCVSDVSQTLGVDIAIQRRASQLAGRRKEANPGRLTLKSVFNRSSSGCGAEMKKEKIA